MIVEETNRVTALLDRMEGIAGGGQVSLSPVNIHEVLDHCLRIASASYGAHMSVRRRYDPSLPPVDGHRDLLIQAFLNIIKNAFEATENKSELTIVTSYSRAQLSAPVPAAFMCRFRSRSSTTGRGSPPIFATTSSTCSYPASRGQAASARAGGHVVADHGGLVEVDSVPGGRSSGSLPPAGQEADLEFAVRAYSRGRRRQVGQARCSASARAAGLHRAVQRHGRGPLETHRERPRRCSDLRHRPARRRCARPAACTSNTGPICR